MPEALVPRVRRAALPADAVIVVRGDNLHPASSRHQAMVFRRRYRIGAGGGSRRSMPATTPRSTTSPRTSSTGFPELSLYRVIDLETAGFAVVATFRTPRVTIAFEGDLDAGLAALTGTAHEQRSNPCHGPDEPEEVPDDHTSGRPRGRPQHHG